VEVKARITTTKGSLGYAAGAESVKLTRALQGQDHALDLDKEEEK